MKFTTVGPLERTLEVASDDAGVEFFIDDSDCHGGTDRFRLSSSEAGRLAVELVQATPGDLELHHADLRFGKEAVPSIYLPNCPNTPFGTVVARADALRLGVALIRAARAAKEAK